jgi:hypothetical protein
MTKAKHATRESHIPGMESAKAPAVMEAATPPPGAEREAAIEKVLASAAQMGVEIDRAEAEDWIAAMANESMGGQITVDVDSGVYGHRVTMADFDQDDLARFREMGKIVGLEDRPPTVMTALAMSGSAAQGKIQTFPADCDFFERVHIKADTREEACTILGEIILDKAKSTMKGLEHRLWEVKWGTHPEDGTVRGEPVRKGNWVSWTPAEIMAGQLEIVRADGSKRIFRWADGILEPGWCKLDWVIGDRKRGILANASNVLDPTWEAPDGKIVPLDGFLEPYFQEVYLETDSIPLFSKLVKQIGGDAVDDYVEALEHEVWKYTVKEPSYGKAARRMYNIFRLTGRYYEAAYIRELFDEPVTALYQVAALMRTVGDAASVGEDTFEAETLVAQVDRLIMSAIGALDGKDEAEMVHHLLRLRDAVKDQAENRAREEDISEVREAALAAVNDYFKRVLEIVPTIKAFLDDIAKRAP